MRKPRRAACPRRPVANGIGKILRLVTRPTGILKRFIDYSAIVLLEFSDVLVTLGLSASNAQSSKWAGGLDVAVVAGR